MQKYLLSALGGILLSVSPALGEIKPGDLLEHYETLSGQLRTAEALKKLSTENRVTVTWSSPDFNGSHEFTPKTLGFHGFAFRFMEDESMTKPIPGKFIGFMAGIGVESESIAAVGITEGFGVEYGFEPVGLAHEHIDLEDPIGTDFAVASERSGYEYQFKIEARPEPLPKTGYEIDQHLDRHRELIEYMQPFRDFLEAHECKMDYAGRSLPVRAQDVRVHGLVVGILNGTHNLSIGHNSVGDGRKKVYPWMPVEYQLRLKGNQLEVELMEVPSNMKKISLAGKAHFQKRSIELNGGTVEAEIPSRVKSGKSLSLVCTPVQ